MVTERAARLRGASIGTRLGTAFLAFILVLLLMGAVGIWRIAELEGVSAHMGRVDIRVERIVTAWHGETRLNLARSLVVARTDDQELQHDLLTQMAATSKRISELQKQVNELTTSDAGKALVEAVGARRQTYLDVRKQVLDLRTTGHVDESLHLLETGLVPASNAYIAAIQAVVDHYSHAVDVYPASAHTAAEAGRAVLLALCVAGLVLGVLCSWLITRSITRPLGLAVHAARRVADGDLAVRVASDRRDEVGALLRAVSDMAGGLRRLVSEVAGGARQLAETSAQIAQGNHDLSQRTEEQATTLEETAGAMEELTATVAQNSANADQAAQLAGSTASIAGRGGAVVGEVVRTMDGITQASRRIGDILGVIDGIAFQTNILALNAAVEAARAGEEGRGFAVVAGEVRSLAQRSAAAAKEIKALIEDSRGQVEAGARLVRSAGETTTEMVVSVQQVSALVAEIASASGEQRSGIEQVNSAVTQMDLVVQQNASLCEQAAAATESMKEQAAALLALVAQFRLEEEPAKWAQPQVRSVVPVLVPA